MTKSSVITNRLLIAMAGLLIDYLFSSDESALISSFSRFELDDHNLSRCQSLSL